EGAAPVAAPRHASAFAVHFPVAHVERSGGIHDDLIQAAPTHRKPRREPRPLPAPILGAVQHSVGGAEVDPAIVLRVGREGSDVPSRRPYGNPTTRSCRSPERAEKEGHRRQENLTNPDRERTRRSVSLKANCRSHI